MQQTPVDPNVRVSVEDLIRLRRRADRLRLRQGQPSRSALAGAHRSRFRGRGMDYQESRHYQPGDDIRNMDWRITARAGRPHVKLYEEERERPVVVLTDFSPSMFFGTRGAFKSVTAARLAALVGWAAIADHDRIGALIFNGGHHELQPAGGRRAVMALIRVLAKAGDPSLGLQQEADPAGLSAALRRLRRVARPGSLIFVISDFYAMDGETGRHLSQLRRHNDIVACQVADPLEMAPPPAGRYGITDGVRTGLLDTRSMQDRRHYEAYFSHHHEAVRSLTEERGIPLIRLSTQDDPAERLAAGLDLLGAGRKVRLTEAA
ncbi:MAG: DUF58 domain-containing protein [Pseudomonadota bacterium]|nr:DUF58 domain-containing protein [Pseudomonadota bacterium]